MRVLTATATTAIIACTDRVVILYMFNTLTRYFLKQKTPVSRPGFEISFLNSIRPSRMNFSPLLLLPDRTRRGSAAIFRQPVARRTSRDELSRCQIEQTAARDARLRGETHRLALERGGRRPRTAPACRIQRSRHLGHFSGGGFFQHVEPRGLRHRHASQCGLPRTGAIARAVIRSERGSKFRNF